MFILHRSSVSSRQVCNKLPR